VHVNEDRSLSPALQDSFLPFRRYVLARHLCGTGEPEVAALAPEAPAAMRSMRFIDEPPTAAPPSLLALPPSAPAAIHQAARLQTRAEIARAREIEMQFPGAFVERRRAH